MCRKAIHRATKCVVQSLLDLKHLQIQSVEKIGSSGTAVWEAFYISYSGVVIKPNQKELCLATGNAIAKRDRQDFTITDDASGALIGKEKPADQAALSRDCSGAIINSSVTFSRSCNALCNDTYTNMFLHYGVAFNVANLSLCDGCNITNDLIGDPQASPAAPPLRSYGAYVPQPGAALTVSRDLTDTGSSYTLRLPTTTRYPIGGGKFSDSRQTPVSYRFDISVINGNREVFAGAIENVSFTTPRQLIKIVFIDGTGFKVDGTNYLASTDTYHETAGDVATFTISAYADLSYDHAYDYYSNQKPGSTTNSVGFLQSPTYFTLYTGTLGTSGASGENLITFTYDPVSKTDIIGKFSINIAGSQPQPRALGAGRYKLIITDGGSVNYLDGRPDILTVNNSKVTDAIKIDINGAIYTYNIASNSKTSGILQSALAEEANPQPFQMEIRDASGTSIYYATNGLFNIIGNRYPPTQAPPTNTLQECFLIQETTAQGAPLTAGTITGADMSDICSGNFDGRLATIQDLQADLAAGADWCIDGWVQITQTLQRVVRPITTSASNIMADGNTRCVPSSNRQMTTTGTIVVTQAAQSRAFVCYGTKPLSGPQLLSVSVGGSTRYFKIGEFNAFKKQWSRKSTGKNMEVFILKSASTTRQNQDICYAAGFTRATKAQLDELAADKVNTADMIVPAYVADDSVRSFVVVNESAGDSRYSTSGRPGVNEWPEPTVYGHYCYGSKPRERTITATSAPSASGSQATSTTYTIVDYNARRRVWSKYDTQPYKTYNLVNRSQIEAEKNAYRKAALILNDIQTSGVAAVKKPDSGNAYIGCDIAAYGCKPAASAERDSAPAQLVSRTQKFKPVDAATPLNPTDISQEGMGRAIAFVLACQKAGGAVPTIDDEYPGCEGPCCVPEESENRLDATMFENACEKPKSSASVEECDAEETPSSRNQVNFEPYRLTRVLKAPTTGAAAKKCTKTQGLFKDLYSALKNEKLFNLRLPATNQ